MRLFEVDLGAARGVLAVIQGLANRQKQSAELPFPVIMNAIKPLGLGISTPDGLIALKDKVDPNGDVIQDVLDNGTVILKTKVPSDLEPKTADMKSAPSVDQMASRAAARSTSDGKS